jgi:HD superfamily phosphohydrolase
VYPGATHSRFEHSLGSMQLATQAFDTIVSKGRAAFLNRFGWSDEEDKPRYKQLLRLGALLHDLGQAPFSHTAEELLPEGYRGHESFTEQFIRSEYICPLLEKFKFRLDVDDVVTVALGPEKKPTEDPSLQLLGELVAGDLGVDRMDYLVRDALHTGAAAGRFDYQRLLNTLTVIDHPATGVPVLAIEAGGRLAAEGLVLARYFMFIQVYFHDVRRIYDRHLVDFLSAKLPEGRFPAKLDEYIKLTDDIVRAEIDEACSAGGALAELGERLRGRNHYRVAYEVTSQTRLQDPDIFDKLSDHLSGKFHDEVRADQVDKEPHTLDEGKLYIVYDDGTTEDILNVSDLIRSLKPFWVGRIYSREDVVTEVREACRQFVMQEGTAS